MFDLIFPRVRLSKPIDSQTMLLAASQSFGESGICEADGRLLELDALEEEFSLDSRRVPQEERTQNWIESQRITCMHHPEIQSQIQGTQQVVAPSVTT